MPYMTIGTKQWKQLRLTNNISLDIEPMYCKGAYTCYIHRQ